VGNLGFTEIMIIVLVVLLLFGAKRLPEVGASIGKGIREFKRNLQPRQPEETPQSKASSGEPKRLSQ
jgi:sec-independent protein translocase protein TatA